MIEIDQLSKKIESLLLSHYPSIVEASRKMDIHKSTLFGIINDKKYPGGKTLAVICEHFNISADNLLEIKANTTNRLSFLENQLIKSARDSNLSDKDLEVIIKLISQLKSNPE